MIDRLITALRDEFDGVAPVLEAVPGTLAPGTVVVAPGDPFLDAGTQATITERWDVLVVFKTTGKDRGVATFREWSLKVRRAVSSVGGLWIQARPPTRANPDANSQVALVANEISFRYQPESE